MTDFVKDFIKIFLLFLFFDTIFIQAISKKYWLKNVEKVTTKPMKLNLFYAFLSYFCIAVGIYVIYKQTPSDKYWLYGILLGIAIYGTYNFTNLGIFSEYDLNVGLLDLVLGTTSITLTLYATHYLSK